MYKIAMLYFSNQKVILYVMLVQISHARTVDCEMRQVATKLAVSSLMTRRRICAEHFFSYVRDKPAGAKKIAFLMSSNGCRYIGVFRELP